MSDSNQQPEKEAVPAESSAKPERLVASPSRRRLIRAGAAAVPVVATLASRPALAWDCQSPSAWGSEQLNPNTSLKNNAGHNKYRDETWTISNWQGNNARPITGVSDKPWNYLVSKFPGVLNTNNAQKNSQGNWINFDYTKVTFSNLSSVTGFYNPGFSNSAKVSSSLSNTQADTNINSYFVVAQLNFVLLAPVEGTKDVPNLLDRCVTASEINAMVKGTYPKVSEAWSAKKVWAYLHNNWIVRGS